MIKYLTAELLANEILEENNRGKQFIFSPKKHLAKEDSCTDDKMEFKGYAQTQLIARVHKNKSFV